MNNLHSELGASGAHRWMLCPGSVELSKGLPNPSSPFAEEGTKAHELAETILLGAISDEPNEINVIPEDTDKEMYLYVKEYTNFVLGELNRCQAKQKLKIELQVEVKITLEEIHKDMFGTVDAMFYSAAEGTLYVFDLKYGKGLEVETEDNPQLLYYALGGWNTCYANKVCLSIVQPRIEGETIKRVNYSADYMLNFTDKLREAVKRVEEQKTTYIPGEKQCQWCLAASICPEKIKQFSSVTTIEPHYELTESNLPNIDNLTIMELSTIYNNSKMLKKWLDDVKDMCTELLKKGENVPKCKLVEQRKNRVFANPKDAEAELRANGFKVKDIKTSKLKSPAQLEKLGVDKKLINELTFTPKGDLVIANQSDRRKPIKIENLTFTKAKELNDE
jgi:hypothetical protein